MAKGNDDATAKEMIDPAEPPVASEVPLTPLEQQKLAQLRAASAPLTPTMKAELDALVAREHIPQPPLTDAERERLSALSEPRKLSDAEAADLDALSRRSDIPSPVVVHEAAAEFHGVLNDLLSLVEGLAAQVPTAHSLGSRIQGLRDRLARAMAAPK